MSKHYSNTTPCHSLLRANCCQLKLLIWAFWTFRIYFLASMKQLDITTLILAQPRQPLAVLDFKIAIVATYKQIQAAHLLVLPQLGIQRKILRANQTIVSSLAVDVMMQRNVPPKTSDVFFKRLIGAGGFAAVVLAELATLWALPWNQTLLEHARLARQIALHAVDADQVMRFYNWTL